MATESTGKGRVTVSPEASVQLVGNGFKIQLEKLRSENLHDQGADILIERGQGCISSPTGPTC